MSIHYVLALAKAHITQGSCEQAVKVCDHGLSLQPTDPAQQYAYLWNDVANISKAQDPQCRIALCREGFRGLRPKAQRGMGTAVPPEAAFAPRWPPESADLDRARARFSSMSDDERQACLQVSFAEMESYCRSGGMPEQCVHRMVRVLSDAEEFVKGAGSSYWICPFCTPIFLDVMEFMSHMENDHIFEKKNDHTEEDKILWPSVPERIPDTEKELLKSWRWEPNGGDDLAERTEILSMVKRIVFQLIDLDAISFNLLFIMHKFIMNRVRAVPPLVVSMCGCCGIGQLSSAHLKELYKFLESLTHTDCEHQNSHNGEKDSHQDSPVLITWSKETRTLSFDCGKIASRNTDGSSQADGLFACLFSETLLEDPTESWTGMRQRCLDHGPGIVNKIRGALDKLKLKCRSHDELIQIHGDAYFFPQAIFESDIDVKPYFDSGIGSLQVEMLLIDVEVDYWKKRLLNNCKLDYLAVILPIAKACLWAKLNTNPPEDALLVRPPNVHELQVPLDVILRSLWHIRRFHDDLLMIPCKCPDVTVGDNCIVLLHEIFRSWDHEKDCSTFAVDDLRSLLIDEKAGNFTASQVVKLILERLHMSQTPLHFEFKGDTLETQTVTVPSFLGCICLTHDLFGLYISENKCNCVSVNEVPTKTEYMTFFHTIDLSSVDRTKLGLGSFCELLKAVDKQLLCDPRNNGGCGHKIARYLMYRPHLLMAVFSWLDNKGSHVNMHETLISLAVEFDISHIYEGLHSESKYTLVSAVCCDDEGQYLCFACDKNRWLIYDGNTDKVKAIPGQLSHIFEF
ncbi:hypothetical protein ABZP36_008484 [Zizania latifolia]